MKSLLFFLFLNPFGSGAIAPHTPLQNLNVFMFVLTCSSGSILEKDVANNILLLLIIIRVVVDLLSLKLLILRLIIMYFWNTQNAADRTIVSTLFQGYLRSCYVILSLGN